MSITRCLNIKWLDDLCSTCSEGGAQLNCRNMIAKGLELRHKIEIITPQNIASKSFEGTDLIIFSNIVNFPRETIKQLCEKYPYIFHHKDFNFYKFRLFYPQLDGINEKGVDRDFWLPIYMKAKLHIWLSPLHRESYLVAFPELKSFKNVSIPSAIDIEMFKPIEGVERKPNTVLAINSLQVFKGRYPLYEYMKEHPEITFTIVGAGAEIELPNIVYLPFVAYNDLPKLLSQFEYFVHLPEGVGPFDRAPVEAKLCGCKIITNENNGAWSYPFIKSKDIRNMRALLATAPSAFWDEVHIAMGVFEI